MSKEEEKDQPKQELNPQLASLCLQFLDRAQISGQEAEAMAAVKQTIKGYAK